MNIEEHFRSLTKELDALKNRVRNFIESNHWITDGEWKESALRAMISEYLPDTVKVGRGFILTKPGLSSQCDILLYRASSPVLFRDGDLVFLTPDSVISVIEVKTSLNRTTMRDALRKLGEIGTKLGDHSKNCCLALFSYETEVEHPQWADLLKEVCTTTQSRVDLVNVGCSYFIKWWDIDPIGCLERYHKWHSYILPEMSAGYFITNILDFASHLSISKNESFWFPPGGKEPYKLEVMDPIFQPDDQPRNV
jgi:hypothetical protein